MTSKTKNLVFLFAFAGMMMAWPMLSMQTATAEGQVTIPGICGVTIPGNVALGTLTPNTEGSESTALVITTDGSVTGTLEITAGDWVGVATESTANIQLVDMIATDIITIGGEAFEATAATQDANNFVIDADQSVSATNLVTAITANTADSATAIATENVVLLRSTSTGTVAANAITLAESESADGSIIISGSTFTGAEDAGVVHMESTVTRYSVTNTSTDPGSSNYATKGAGNAFLVETADKVIIPETDPDEDIHMIFQLTGVGTLINLPYSGALTQSLTFSTVCSE